MKYKLGDNIPHREFYRDGFPAVISRIQGDMVTIRNKDIICHIISKTELSDKYDIEID